MIDDFLTVKELSVKIRLSTQTIYNKISRGDFILNIHYFKPTPKRVLFRESPIERWLRGDETDVVDETPSVRPPKSDPQPQKSRFNI